MCNLFFSIRDFQKSLILKIADISHPREIKYIYLISLGSIIVVGKEPFLTQTAKNKFKNLWKTCGKPVENLWKTCGKPA